jgi:hypothetical protein
MSIVFWFATRIWKNITHAQRGRVAQNVPATSALSLFSSSLLVVLFRRICGRLRTTHHQSVGNKCEPRAVSLLARNACAEACASVGYGSCASAQWQKTTAIEIAGELAL